MTKLSTARYRTLGAPLFAFTAPEKMTDAVFDAMLLAIAQSTHNHLEGMDASDDHANTYQIGAYEAAAFTISCLIAQRYDGCIGTSDVVEALALHRAMADPRRAQRIAALLKHFRT